VPQNASFKSLAKAKVYAHIEMWRPYTVIWSGLVGLVGACLAFGGLPSSDIAALALFIPMMGWIGGLYLSDILDRNLDSIEKPHRPIPSGRISPLEAFLVGLCFALSGIVLIVWKLNLYNLVLAAVIAALVFLYAFFSKSHGLFGHLNRGLMTVVAFVFGVVCINQPLSSVPVYVWLMAVVFFVHDTDSNMVGAIRDMEGDRAGGYLTFPARYGLRASFALSIVLTVFWWALTVGLVVIYDVMSVWFFVGLGFEVAVLLALYFYFLKSLSCYSRSRGLRFHEFFVVERILFAIALLMGLVEVSLAVGIGVIALAVTLVAQKTLRRRYEFAASSKGGA